MADARAEKCLTRDVFLSDAFGIEWQRVSGRLSSRGLESVQRAVRELQAGTKVDATVAADDLALVRQLERTGWRLASTKITYVLEAGRPRCDVAATAGVEVVPLRKQDEETLVRRAPEIIDLDRYRHDPDLDKNCIPGMFRQWMQNNIGHRCEVVLTAVSGDEVVGFLCAIAEPGGVYFELIGVCPECRGRGLGRMLVGSAARRYPDLSPRVVTQYQNLAMQRVLVRCGFMPASAEYVFTCCSGDVSG